ncbi:MAG: phosphomannose isomerase type II C-terminal cupin domain [Candidatus Omnitrophica bacterium]|nr:phosphomannose isomerase type II C-terminal cupin domain [Candidatus Omnitrophota bacterium]
MVDKNNKREYDERPWGTYEVLKREPGMWVKRIEVKPWQRLSLQRHLKRSEHWIVVAGQGVVTKGDEDITAPRGRSIDIRLGEKHRMSNRTDKPVVFIEVAFGDYLEEDDIERLEDDYHRT